MYTPPQMQSYTNYKIGADALTIWAEDWQGPRFAGKRIERQCSTPEEAKIALYELEAPTRQAAAELEQALQRYNEDVALWG